MKKMENVLENLEKHRNICEKEYPILVAIREFVYNEFSKFIAEETASIETFESWKKNPITAFSGSIYLDNILTISEFSPIAKKILENDGISIVKIGNCGTLDWKLDLTRKTYLNEDICSAVKSYQLSVENCDATIELYYTLEKEITSKLEDLLAAFINSQTGADLSEALTSSKNIEVTIIVQKLFPKKVIDDVIWIFEYFDFDCILHHIPKNDMSEFHFTVSY